MKFTSRLKQFYKYSSAERRNIIADMLNLSPEQIDILQGKNIDEEIYEILVENVIGKVCLPLGIATNFRVNNKDYLIPMAIEESSVIAAASHAAKIARACGGFEADYTGSFTIGQIQILDIKDFDKAEEAIRENKTYLLNKANETNDILVKLGGGAKEIELKKIKGDIETYLIVQLIVDTKDAMGANAVNTMLEHLKGDIEKLTKGRVLLRILSNYATRRVVTVKATFDRDLLGGKNVVDDILKANDFAFHDVYRAVTHNKGIMNGITAVVIATGNDSRAIEAGVHAYAARDGVYRSLSRFEKDETGNLIGELQVPLGIGVLGGAINVHPIYKVCLQLMNVKTAEELSKVVVAVGLAQNVAALRALVAEGIQKGHMSLHARNIAIAIGAEGDEIEKIAKQMIVNEEVSYDEAKRIYKETKKGKTFD